jgi:CRISPR-associated protein Cas2
MWLFVFFDLPVGTKKERKAAMVFRKNLEKDGFGMMQFSVYTRFCASRENAEVHVKRVKRDIPLHGSVSILMITDKQYGEILNFCSQMPKALKRGGQQLELF